MPQIEPCIFCDAVNSCPRLNGRLMRAIDALLDLEIEMSPLGRLARWLEVEDAPEDDRPAPATCP
jgi:hypothetical protein